MCPSESKPQELREGERYIVRRVPMPMTHWVVIDIESSEIIWDKGLNVSREDAQAAASEFLEALNSTSEPNE